MELLYWECIRSGNTRDEEGKTKEERISGKEAHMREWKGMHEIEWTGHAMCSD